MNITLNDLQKYIYENYGQQPIQKQFEWQKYLLYYPVKDGELELCLRYYTTDDERDGKQFISFCFSRSQYSGWCTQCDSYDELDNYLNKYMTKKMAQLSLF